MAEPVARLPVAGGDAPDVGTLLNATIADLSDDIGPYVLAGLGHTLVVMPIVFIAIFVMYFGIIFGTIGGAVGMGVFAAMIGGMLGETAGGLSVLLSQLLLLLMMFVGVLAFGAGLGAILAPFNASLTRAIAAYQRGEGELGIGSAFETLTQDLGKTIGAAVLISCIAMVLLMMCYLPVLAVPLVLGFYSPLVHLHRKGPVDALKITVKHFQGHMSFHLTMGAVMIGLGMVASYVPVLGPIFLSALHVRAYREMFGDGEEPVLT